MAASHVELKGSRVTASKLLVFFRGAAEPSEDDEAAFLAAPRGHLAPDVTLRGVVGSSSKAFFLVTASLPLCAAAALGNSGACRG